MRPLDLSASDADVPKKRVTEGVMPSNNYDFINYSSSSKSSIFSSFQR